jgi:transcriptional regulator with XRE-family HTH domain
MKKPPITKAQLLLGKRIERLRLLQGITHRQIGRAVKKKDQDVAQYEKGAFVPLAILETIAKLLGAPIRKKIIRRISYLRKVEWETRKEQEELGEIYVELLEQKEEKKQTPK